MTLINPNIQEPTKLNFKDKSYLDFDSIIIADFKESLKSVVTSLLYTDVSPKEKYIVTGWYSYVS